MPTRAEAKVTTDHDEIRQWAEERGASPACVRRTGGKGDIGILRLDFPGYSGANSLEHISWDDWFEKFDERGLALLHQNTTARGQKSNFNKLISRETAEATSSGRRGSLINARSRPTGSSRGTSSRSRTKSRSASSRSGARKTAAPKSASKSARTRSTAAKSRSRGTASSTRSRSAAKSRGTSTRSKSNRRSASTASTSNRSRRATSSASRKSPSRSTAKTNRRTASSRGGNTSATRGSRSAKSRYLTDHDEIRQWAEERDATPACVRGTGRSKGDTGMIRLDFPGYSGATSLKAMEWDDWFEQFDDNNLALVVQDSTARGQRSNFNKIVGRETVAGRKQGSHASRRHPERGRKTTNVQSIGNVRGSRAQTKSTRGSTRGARTATARGQHGGTHRRAA